jgi:hypothetical protein
MARDEQIKSDVLDTLRWDPEVGTSKIGVIAKNGAVTLTGTVPSYPARVAAEQAAKRVKGVRAVAEEIKVELVHANRHSGEAIAHRIARMFEWSSSIGCGSKTCAQGNAGFVQGRTGPFTDGGPRCEAFRLSKTRHKRAKQASRRGMSNEQGGG